MDIETYALAKRYTDKEVAGGGAIKGKNCVITEIEEITGGHRIHFQWTLDDGTVETDTMDVMDGSDVDASEINGNIRIDDEEVTVYNDAEVKADIEELEGIVSDGTKTAEGNPINFTTLSAQTAKSTILSLEPIQDLHGYDKPWVGGAGKNILPMTLNNIKSINTDGTWNGNVYSIYSGTVEILTDSDNNVLGIKPSGTFTSSLIFELCGTFTLQSGSYILNGCPSGGGGGLYRITCISNEGNLYDTGSGAEVSLEDSRTYTSISVTIWANVSITGKVFYPMIRLSTEPDATFQPYTNECGISGRSEIGILGCGKNLLPLTLSDIKGFNTSGTWTGNVYAISGINITVNTDTDGNVTKISTSAGTPSATIVFTLYYDTTNFLPDNKSFVLNGCPSGGSGSTFKIDLVDNISGVVTAVDFGGGSSTFETPTVINNINCRIVMYAVSQTAKDFYPMIRLSTETDSSFAPYTKSNNLTISLGQTVYGGTLDVENGVLVVDRKYVTITSMTRNSATKYFANVSPVAVADDFTYIKSDRVETSDGEGVGIFSNWMGAIRLNTPIEFDNASDMMAFYGNEINVCYKLATPIIINLTPHTINLLKGVNNISTDGDKITLTYRDGSVATLGDLTSAVDELDGKIEDSKILTDTVTGDKYILVVTNGVLDIQQVSNEQAQSLSMPSPSLDLQPPVTEPEEKPIEEPSEEIPTEETSTENTEDEER